MCAGDKNERLIGERMIYLDNAATTAVSDTVLDAMLPILKHVYGNPSSIYQFGRLAKQHVEQARQTIANSIHAKPSAIIFTSGGTESNNTALMSLARTTTKKHIISTCIEHPSIKTVLQQLETQGYDVTYLPVNANGCITVQQVKDAITDDTAFVTIMAVNNETGAKQPIEDIALLLHEQHIPFHTDAVQAFGTQSFNMAQTPIAMMSVSSHKIHGPKGIGFLYVNENALFQPFINGGGQESNRRSGTENVANIVGFAKAVELLNVQQRTAHFEQLQQTLLQLLNDKHIAYDVNGSIDLQHKTPKIINLYLKNTTASKLLIQLDLANIMVSAGSACSAGSLQPSAVLLQQYPNQSERARQSIRVSFSEATTIDDIQTFVEKLHKFTV